MAFGGLDIGSSGVKCAFFNERGKRLAFARQDYDYSSHGGHYELDGRVVWNQGWHWIKRTGYWHLRFCLMI